MAGSTDFPTALDSLGSVTDAVDDVDDDHINDLRRAVEALETKVGIDSSAVTTSLDYLVKNFITSGRAVWIYEDGAAPTGWALDAAADALLGVIGGSEDFDDTAGQVVGSWTQPDHTLTTAELPSHAHAGSISVVDAYSAGLRTPVVDAGVRINGASAVSGSVNGSYGSTSAVGSGSAHNHGTTYRPKTALGQIIVKS